MYLLCKPAKFLILPLIIKAKPNIQKYNFGLPSKLGGNKQFLPSFIFFCEAHEESILLFWRGKRLYFFLWRDTYIG